MVDQVVKAIEQSGLKEGLELTGEQKLRHAIQETQKLLDERGLKNISADTIATVIRAALRDGVHKEWPHAIIDPKSLAQIESVQIPAGKYLLNGEVVELEPLPPPRLADDDDTVEIDQSYLTDLRYTTPSQPLDTH